MKATIFGATGMVGIEVLHHCLNETRFKQVVTIGRHVTGVTHPKLREIEHHDFTDYGTLKSELSETSVCFYCLGVYQGKVSTEKFWEITCTYFESLLEFFQEVGPGGTTFCLLSAQGADPREKSPFLFAKAKGRAEKKFMDAKIKKKYIFRPGYINPGRKVSKSRIPAWVVKPFYKLFPGIGIDAPMLAGVMVEVGLNGCLQVLFENTDIRKMGQGQLKGVIKNLG
jgi:uncharacterized protein YbjT (DUF2867 family)